MCDLVGILSRWPHDRRQSCVLEIVGRGEGEGREGGKRGVGAGWLGGNYAGEIMRSLWHLSDELLDPGYVVHARLVTTSWCLLVFKA